MILLLLYSALFQVGNNYVVNFIDPYVAFFLIYSISTIVFLITNIRKETFKINNSAFSIPIIILGQILSPIFYFKGVFLTDILTQSIIYSFYPISILFFSKIYDNEKIFNKHNIILLSILIIQVFITVKNINLNEGAYYLIISCVCLIAHKIIHKIAIKRHSYINEYSTTFYGLMGSATLGLILLISNKVNIENCFDFISYINIQTSKGLLFIGCFFLIVFILGKIQFKRNLVLNKNKFELLYLYIIILPPFAVLINNYLYFIDNKIEINLSIYKIEGLLYLLVFFLIKLDWRVIVTYISSSLLFLALLSSQILIDLEVGKTDSIKIIYNEDNRIGLVKRIDNKWVFEKNKYDYDKYQFEKEKIELYENKEFKNDETGENIQLYFKEYIASDESIIVYDTKNYNKYIFKALNNDIYSRMKTFKTIADDKNYLVDYKIIKDNEKNYFIITDFVNGLTFEDYYAQYNKEFIKGINQESFIKDIIKIAEINLDLMKSGWINRDIHQNNILVTSKGITMIDYDLVFPINDSSNIIDTNGFKNNLYDIYRLFYPKRDIIKNKFYFESQYELDFKKNKELINENLKTINRYIQDNSYLYSDKCDKNEIEGLEELINDLKEIDKIKIEAENEPTNINSNCVNNATFYNSVGGPSFQLFNLPSRFFSFNYINILDFNKKDLDMFVNKNILYNLQQNGTNDYVFNKKDVEAEKEIKSFILSK